MIVAYVCDGKAECSNKIECFLNGGPCHHTFKVEHAKNFKNVENQLGEANYKEDLGDESVSM